MHTIESIKRANKAAGHFFFEPASMRFFASRVGSFVVEGPGGVYFVTSEQFRPSHGTPAPRRYSVRKFEPETGHVNEGSEFQAFASLSGAKRAAQRMADGTGRP